MVRGIDGGGGVVHGVVQSFFGVNTLYVYFFPALAKKIFDFYTSSVSKSMKKIAR